MLRSLVVRLEATICLMFSTKRSSDEAATQAKCRMGCLPWSWFDQNAILGCSIQWLIKQLHGLQQILPGHCPGQAPTRPRGLPWRANPALTTLAHAPVSGPSKQNRPHDTEAVEHKSKFGD